MSALVWFAAIWMTFGTLVAMARPMLAKDKASAFGASLAIVGNVVATVVIYVVAVRGLS